MTDRELLEKAAKAAGLGEVWYLDGSDTPYVGPRYKIGETIKYTTFNPRYDDADAFRLAVALHLKIEHYSFTLAGFDHVGASNAHTVMYGNDPCAATRLAILRAAAAIGEQK